MGEDVFFTCLLPLTNSGRDNGDIKILIMFVWYHDQDGAVKEVVEFMNVYSISQEDFDTIVGLSKLQVSAPT